VRDGRLGRLDGQPAQRFDELERRLRRELALRLGRERSGSEPEEVVAAFVEPTARGSRYDTPSSLPVRPLVMPAFAKYADSLA